MLDQIPPEILTHIALHLSLASLNPSLALLLTSKQIYNTIAPSLNPRLYARIFRANFDTSAAQRRLGGGTSDVRGDRDIHGSGNGEELTAVYLTDELQRRGRALRRLRWMCEKGDLGAVRDEDLWVIYLMLIENDGNNLSLMLHPTGHFHLPQFLKLYHEQHLLAAALEPGYPAETVGRSLIMWISWLMASHDPNHLEPPSDRDERLFVLRPYVFAAQQYDLYFAPWTLSSLPITSSSAGELFDPESIRLEPGQASPFVADLQPKSRQVRVGWYGREVEIGPPMLAHAAILRFFHGTAGEGSKDGGSMLNPFQAFGGDRQGEGQAIHGTNGEVDEEEDDAMESTQSLIVDSRIHDRDFQRLLSCYDPRSCSGMPRKTWRGSWDGCWEGNFSFFDFDAFREMLAGQSRALYEGPFGEQRQVWRLRETYVRPVRRGEPKGKGKEVNMENGYEAGLPLNGRVVNAGFPEGPGRADLSSVMAEQTTLRDTIRQQVDALEGYEIVPDEEVDEALEMRGTEMLLTGTGHSAWGRFILKGRVRLWDGMASLVKEYSPDSRGKWFYRGYVLAGDVFVGRWRDTFTPEAYVGYEGTFTFTRRS